MTSNDQPQSASDGDALDLLALDTEYEGAEEPEGSQDVPDGKYTVTVEGAELVTTRTGKPMLKWTLRILGPQFQGRMLWRNNVIGRDNLGYLKADLRTCGVVLPKLSELPKHLHELLHVTLEVTKRTRDENSNVYLNKRVEAAPGGAASALPPF